MLIKLISTIESKENVSRWHHENGSKSDYEDHLEWEKKQF
jgi:hypothetical protein